MKIKLINDIYEDYYLQNYVKNYGIYDLGEYLDPPIRHLQNPSFLDNIQEGYNLIKDKNKIHIIVDSDCDGMTSASILYLYLKDWKPNINITYTLHTGKQHGLEDQMDYFLSNKDIDLVVVPDAGSNDFQYIEQLKELSIPILILDHHILETEVSSNCVIINNQVSQKYRNKALTGAGVVWQFCRYIDSQIQESFADKYIDLAALGIN